jgi:hypothetical protein
LRGLSKPSTGIELTSWNSCNTLELAGRLAEATDEAVIVDITEEPVPGVVAVTEFESVQTREPEAP